MKRTQRSIAAYASIGALIFTSTAEAKPHHKQVAVPAASAGVPQVVPMTDELRAIGRRAQTDAVEQGWAPRGSMVTVSTYTTGVPEDFARKEAVKLCSEGAEKTVLWADDTVSTTVRAALALCKGVQTQQPDLLSSMQFQQPSQSQQPVQEQCSPATPGDVGLGNVTVYGARAIVRQGEWTVTQDGVYKAGRQVLKCDSGLRF